MNSSFFFSHLHRVVLLLHCPRLNVASTVTLLRRLCRRLRCRLAVLVNCCLSHRVALLLPRRLIVSSSHRHLVVSTAVIFSAHNSFRVAVLLYHHRLGTPKLFQVAALPSYHSPLLSLSTHKSFRLARSLHCVPPCIVVYCRVLVHVACTTNLRALSCIAMYQNTKTY